MVAASGNPIALGIDIGGTRIKAIALECPDQVIGQYEGPSDADISPEAVRKAIGLAVQYFYGKGLTPFCIGVGCAGSVTPDSGVVRNSPNFSNWLNVPLKDWISQDYHLPTTVDNDANCAAFSEWKIGNGKGSQNMVLLTLGTGVGGGVIIQRQLYKGSTGTGAELGHFSIYANGKKCPCGNSGCFERYCSASALREAAGGKFSAREIFMQAGKEPFPAIIERFLADFKVGLTSLANVFDPDCIVIGGGVAKGVAVYFDEIKGWLKSHAFPSVGKNVRLEVTKFGNLSGAIGAALLAAQAHSLMNEGSHSVPT